MGQGLKTSRAQMPTNGAVGFFTLSDFTTLAQYLSTEADPSIVVGEDHVAKALV